MALRQKRAKSKFMTEEQVYEAQEQYILANFGKRAWRNANYGWCVDGRQVSTKVYGHGILVSTPTAAGGLTHDFEEF